MTGFAEGYRCPRSAQLIREIVGNPFRNSRIAPAWLTPTVVSLSQAVFEERLLPAGYLERPRLAVLADILEDAGCADEEILVHRRDPDPRVRGCWALDRILVRE